MKKFLASVFILAVFSAVVFYLGWTQFKIKPENMGVVISKTDGISDTPVLNGEFSWFWQFLLPTNAELKSFCIKPVNVDKTVKGQLPSGDVYTSIYNSSDSFAYNFDFSISLTVSPQMVIELLKLNKISDNDDLQEYINRSADTLAQLAADYYLKKAGESSNFRPESVRREDILRAVRLYEDCPEVDVSLFALVSSKIPDYGLYKKIQSNYQIAGIANAAVEETVIDSDNEPDVFDSENIF